MSNNYTYPVRARYVTALLVAVLLAIFSCPRHARGDIYFVSDLASIPCAAGSPILGACVVDGASATDCSAGGGSTDVCCACLNGAWSALASAAGGGYATCQEEGSSLTARTTLNFVGASVTCADAGGKTVCTFTDATGPSVILDLGDDGGNDSTGLGEIAPVNDYGGAFSEPSADKLAVDVSKLRPASMDHPRASPDANDCEFSGSVCGWSWAVSAGTSAPASGTINPISTISGDPVYDLTSWPGFLLVQSDETSGESIRLNSGAVTIASSATIVAKVSFEQRNHSTDGEGAITLTLFNTSDSNESVSMQTRNTGAAWIERLGVENNGTFTVANSNGATEAILTPTTVYLWLWRDTNNYYGGWSTGQDSVPTVFQTAVTKTGVTTLDGIRLSFITANETPSVIWSVDWVRYYAGNTLAVVNP